MTQLLFNRRRRLVSHRAARHFSAPERCVAGDRRGGVRRHARDVQRGGAAAEFPGLLVDFDHFSHDPAQPTTAAGWLGALEHRGDGCMRGSGVGPRAPGADGGRYRLASPTWNRADCDQWTAPAPDGRDTVHLRPRRLDRLALTNIRTCRGWRR